MKRSSADLINYAHFPIFADSPKRDAVIERVRSDLARDGCAVLKGF